MTAMTARTMARTFKANFPPCEYCGSEPNAKRTKRGRVTTIVVMHPEGGECTHGGYKERTRSSLHGLAVKCARRSWSRSCAGGLE